MVGFWRDCVLVSKYIPMKPECDTLCLNGMLSFILVLLLIEHDVRLLIGLSDWCRWVSIFLEIVLVTYFLFKIINFWYVWIILKLCNFWSWRYLGVSRQSVEIWAPIIEFIYIRVFQQYRNCLRTCCFLIYVNSNKLLYSL